MDAARRGAKALEDNDISGAVVAYTKALIEHPTSPDYYVQRSTAFTRLKPPHHDLALKDADIAVVCAKQRAKRDKIQAAQFRRVVSLYNTGNYADAKFILQTTAQYLEEKDKPGKMQADMWRTRIENKLKTITNASTVQVKEYPELVLPDSKSMVATLKKQIKSDGSYNFDGEQEEETEPVKSDVSSEPVPQNASVASTAASTAPAKFRHEWYQNAQSVIVTLYAKGVPKDKVEVDIQDDSVGCNALSIREVANHLYRCPYRSLTQQTQTPHSPSPSILSSLSLMLLEAVTTSCRPRSNSPSRRPPLGRSGAIWKAQNHSRRAQTVQTTTPNLL